jgi:hypothetical protein
MRMKKALEGWQAGAVAVVVAWVGALLVVPRDVEPRDLPRVTLDWSDVAQARAKLAAARDVAAPGLQGQLFEARFRAFGREEQASEQGVSPETTNALREIGVEMRKSGFAELATVRDRLAAEFVASALEWIRSGTENEVLGELGGPFVKQARDSGWTAARVGQEPALDLALWALFDRRFQALVGPKDDRLAPNATANRALGGLFLMRPPQTFKAASSAVPAEAEVSEGTFLLRKIDELAAIAPDYPALFAKGVVYYRMGRFESAAAAFDRYVDERPRGPHRLRAINHLRASVVAASGG